MSKHRKSITPSARGVLYAAVSFLIIGLAFLGSRNKDATASNNLSIDNIADNGFNVSTDQLSEFYMVANTASALNLASVDVVSSNYVTISAMRNTGQTGGDSGTIEKPNYTDTSNISRGVITYTVQDGDSMADIAAKQGITTDQIRWSNGLKTTDISAGQVLYIPSVPGIVYDVKAGDSLASIVKTYGSSIAAILEKNNLSSENVPAGSKIILPNGVLPAKLRPEYVAPVVARRTSYSYFGSTSQRQDIVRVYENVWTDAGNRMVPGQCTWYAWWWRAHSPLSLGKLPDGLMGNANRWDDNLAAAGYRIDRTPQVGAVFQTDSGIYGHVGVVIAVNGDGSIRIREMNYNHRAYVIVESTVPANVVGNFKYIH